MVNNACSHAGIEREFSCRFHMLCGQTRRLFVFVCMILGRGLLLRYRGSHWKQSTSSLRNRTARTMSTDSYLAVHVKGSLVGDGIERFYEETLKNARNSILESGISRFDVLRSVDVPSNFLLIEVYKTAADPDKHKLTQHYKDWRVAVEPLMAVPRAAIKYSTVFPPPTQWDTFEASSAEDTASYQQHRPWSARPFDHASSGEKGGILARLLEITVQKNHEAEFQRLTAQWCAQALQQPVAHRVDFLANNANAETVESSRFLLVLMQGAAHPALDMSQWEMAVAPMLAAPTTVSEYMTLFPSPLYYLPPSALTHPGEGQRFVQQQAGAAAEAWAGHRGLATTQLGAGAFGFQGPKILMGRGIAATAIKDTLKALRLHRPLLVTGAGGLARNAALWEAVFPASPSLTNSPVSYDHTAHAVSVSGEPTVEDAQRICAFAVAQGCDSVLAVGGGSALDVGKAVAALIPNAHRDIFDFLEVIGKGLPLEKEPLPFIAVPTTSGTGSEATKNAVLKSVQHGLKVSIRHEKMFPVVAVLDPLLTLSCPPSVTAHVGMDTLCQCLEPFVCCVPNPFVDALAREGMTRAARSLRDAVADGARNVEAREDMAVASVMGGLCLANAKLGAVHGFAAVLGGRFEHAAHGALCAALLPFVFEANAQHLQSLANGGEAGQGPILQDRGRLDAMVRLARFEDVSRILSGNPTATVQDGVQWLHMLMRDINIPRLGVLCPELQQVVEAGGAELQAIITATMNASSTKGNPLVLSQEQLLDILLKAL